MSEPASLASVEMTTAEGAGRRANTTRASVAGAGGGTGLVALAQALGPDTVPGKVLLYLAPTLSVVAGAAFYFLGVQVERYYERRLVVNARRTLEAQLDSSRTSEQHKRKIRRLLEELEETVASKEIERVRLLGKRADTSGVAVGKH